MNHFYYVAGQKRTLFSKRFLMLLIFFMGMFGTVCAQVTVSGTTPVSNGVYPTLKAAFDAINAGTHQGVITVLIVGNTTEAATAVLNSSVLPANYSSVSIRPATPGRTVTGNLATSIVKLSGADHVTIDGFVGAGPARDLTFSNANTSSSSGVVWVASASSSDGAGNNLIQNCIITGSGAVNSLVGLIQCSGTTIGGLAETANSNNSYINNLVTGAQFGIGVVGTPSNQDNQSIISNNTVNSLGRSGIFVSNQKNVLVSQNTISGVNSNLGNFTIQNTGVYVVGTTSGGLIEKNVISDIRISSVWGCSGIQLDASNTGTGLTVANNFIRDISAGGWLDFDTVDDNACGIAVDAGTGYNIYYNTIDLDPSANEPQAATYNPPTACIWIASPSLTSPSPMALNIRNNIFSNRETTGRPASVFTYSTNSIFTAIDYNDYFCAGVNLGFLVTNQANFFNWITATAKDLNSVSVLPGLISATNLHLSTGPPVTSASPLNHLATSVAGITTDIDGDARDAVKPDIGADEIIPVSCSGNAAGSISAFQNSFCASGSTLLVGTGFALGEGITYQWQSSTTSATGPWTNISGANNPLHLNTGNLVATTYYQLTVQCSSGPIAATAPVTVTINNPSVTAGPTPPARCGTGTVDLTATGTNLTWYSAASGGSSIGSGSPFTTPVISTTTTFWVSASTVGSISSGGKPSTTGADGGANNTDAGLRFDATQAFKLISVKIYPQAAGDVDIAALNNAGTVLGTQHVHFNAAAPGGIVVNLGFNIPVGNNHRLVLTTNSSSLSIWRDNNGLAFPYGLSGAGSITNGWLGGSGTGVYFYFYDWQISTSFCESLRVSVLASVNTPPAFTTVTPSSTICQGSSVTLNATGGSYTSYVWNPGGLPNGTVVTPLSTTSYTITANTTPIGPGCRRDDIITITVNSTPTALTISPLNPSLCPNITPATQITVTGGNIPGQSIFTQNAETPPAFLSNFGGGVTTGVGISVVQNNIYFQQGASSIQMTNGNSASGSIESVNIPLTGFTSPTLSFYHIAALESSSGIHWDVGYVEYSINGGTSWTKFPVSSYGGSGTIVSQVGDGPIAGVGFDKTSYPDWNSQFTLTTSTPGPAPATSLWKHETIDLTTWQGMPNFKIRFRILSDASLSYYGWLIDNIQITGTGQAPIIWSSNTNLYTTPAHSTNINTLLSNPIVYFFTPANVGPTIYTVSASNGLCSASATTTIQATTATPSVTITANPSGPICSGTCVTFTANPLGVGSLTAFNWKVNGTSVSGGSQTGLTTFTLCNLVQGDMVSCDMSTVADACHPGGSVVSSNIISMTVNPTPTANPITTSTGTTVCTGTPNILTETPVGVITTYQWLLNNNPAPGGTNSSTYSATLPGDYRVVVVTGPGCRDTSAIFVITKPVYTITVIQGANGTITPSGPVLVNCGDTPPAFSIVPNSGYSIQNVLVNGVSVGPVTSYTFGPMTGDSTISATFFIAGCSTPASASAGANSFTCGTNNFSLSGSVTGAVTTGTWTTSGSGTFNPNNNYPGATSYTPSAADVSAGTVNLTLTSATPALPCLPSSATMTLTIKPVPSVSITGIPGICSSGATTHLLTGDTSATTVNITGFQWYHPFPTAIGGATTNALTINATGNYTVVVTGINGCTATAAITSTTLAPPTVSASGLGPICTDATVDINASGSAGSGTLVSNGYQWYMGGSPISGANISIYSAGAAGSYQVTASNSNGCVSGLSAAVSLASDTGPLNGVYSIGAGVASCTNYVSFAKAINDLNTRGISGNCIFNVVADYTETVPTNGLKLGSALLNGETSPSGTNYSIRFDRSGVGADPLLTAYTGGISTPATAIPDGIWSLNGVDNVTINQIAFTENAANGAGNTAMEYAIGLFKFSVSDGCQYNTIQNCTITLNKANSVLGAGSMVDGSSGILLLNGTYNNAINPLTPTSAAGTNSYNKFYHNTISNCHQGIALWGYVAPSPFTLGDFNNDVGGTSTATANTITNFGNNGDPTIASGLRILNQFNVNVSYNTIVNNNGTGSNTTNQLRGIWAPVGSGGNATFSGNTITLTSDAPVGQQVIGIENYLGASGVGNSVLISDNVISATSTTVTTANMTGIQNAATAASVNIINNSIQNCSLPGTGSFTGIINSVAVTNLAINSNTIKNNTKTSTGTMTLIGTGASTTAVVNSNILRDNVVAGGGAAVTLNCIIGNTSNYTVDGNYIYNNSVTNMTGTAIATVYGYSNIVNPLQETITNNTISRLFVGGSSSGLQIIRGIYNNTNNNVAHFRIVSRNIIDSLYSGPALSAAITGIWSQVGYNVTISKNKIIRLWPGQNTTIPTLGSFAQGIRLHSGTTVKVSNNIIGIDLTQGPNNGLLRDATSVSGIEVAGLASAASVANIYYNTIRIAGAGSGPVFGTSGISISSAINTNGTVDLRDNLVANFAAAGGTGAGLTVALRKTGATAYASTSNNNLWYTTQTATTPIYYTGVASPTLAAFKLAVAPRETFSIGDLPMFVNAGMNDLHLDPANNCNLDGAGAPIATYTDDYDGDTRDPATPDIGMDEFDGTGTGFTWKGVNTDWLNPANWCGGVPTATSDVVIPGGKVFYPIIINGLPVAHNINIIAGGSIVINAAGTLSTTGSWTNDGSLTNNGTIVLNGTTNQSFPGGGAGTIPAMNNLTASNNGGVTINKPLTMIGNLKPKAGNLAVNDVVTLHSDASGTAFVDTLQGTISYNSPGKFVVERFITTNNIGPSYGVGWRFLAASITGTQTINQAWQEGQAAGTYTATGYGTQIVGPGGTPVGFDMANTLPSLKKYDAPTNTYIGVPGTIGTNYISAPDGYMLFIRGDRGANVFGMHNATTLRMSGPIKTGPVTLSTATANQFISVGNPYPCAISFGSASTVKTNLQDVYYIWDPKLGTYGAFQTFAGPTYVASPGGGSYATLHANIESGMGFFVKANGSAGSHSIQITENSKMVGSYSVARVNSFEKQLQTRLYSMTVNGPALYDGNRVDFDPSYSNAVDDNDAEKLNNFGENIGILRDGKTISVERRAEIVDTDTIFFKMGQMKVQDYQLEFTAENLSSPILTAYLEDAFLNTRTQISLDAVTTITFTITADPASKAEDRFRIVFKQQGIVPLSFISISAFRQDNSIMIDWNVANEMNIANYEVQRSADGRIFNGLATQSARDIAGIGSEQYNLADMQPLAGDNFYRIKSVNYSGEIKYSEIVKVNMKGDPAMITVYPNPVGEDGNVTLNMTNEPKGIYKIYLTNTLGQVVLTRTINHEGGNSVYSISLNNVVAHGNYQLQVSRDNTIKTTFKVLY